MGYKIRHFQICSYFKTVRDINLKLKVYDQGRIRVFSDDDDARSSSISDASSSVSSGLIICFDFPVSKISFFHLKTPFYLVCLEKFPLSSNFSKISQYRRYQDTRQLSPLGVIGFFTDGAKFPISAKYGSINFNFF